MGQLVLELHRGRPSLRELRRVGAWDDGSGRLCAIPYESAGGPVIEWPGVGWYRFDQTGVVRCWVDPEAVGALAAATFERLRPLILQRLGLEALHASAVRVGDGIVAFCGVSGAGKSTLAYALAQRGHAHAADDYLVLDVGERVDALTFPFQPRLRAAARRHVGQEAPANTGRCSRIPLSAIVLLRREERGAARMSRLDPAAAFPALLAHAHCYSLEDGDRRRRTVEHYLRLVGSVPVYDLGFEPGFDTFPELVDSVERLVKGAPVQSVSLR